jgi:hypothetical protein
VVVLLPDKEVTNIYKRAVFAAFTAIEKRQLRGVALSGYDVNQDNLNFLFSMMSGRKIVIYFGHADSYSSRDENKQPNGPPRTRFTCYRQSKVRYPGRYFNLGAYSYTKQQKSIANPDSIPSYREGNIEISRDDFAYDITKLCEDNSVTYCKIDQMYIFGCLSAANDDMAVAQGCGGLHDRAAQDMLYAGFTEDPWTASGGISGKLVSGLVLFFQKLGEGKTVDQTWDYLNGGYVEGGIQEALFINAGLKFYGLNYGSLRLGNQGD